MTRLNDNGIEDQPAVHVLVVAVNEYPHLERDGYAPQIDTGGMGQLSSPSGSAERFAKWIQNEFKPRDIPLGTLDVLCSGPATFKDSLGQIVVPDRPTLANLRVAAKRWFDRCSKSEDSVAVFYFCGHGVTSGAIDSLLLEDFGSDALDPFQTGAIDAGAFADGMRKCSARRQLLFFDACRTAPDSYLREFGTHRGVPLISAATHTNLGQIDQMCLWASELGLPAYGRPGQASVFCDALLASMRGASAVRDMVHADWHVLSTRLVDGINAYVARSLGKKRQFANPTRMSMGFPFHVLSGQPVVPVEVGCSPSSRTKQIHLRFDSGDSRTPGHTGNWHLELPYGNYVIEALEGSNGPLVDQQPCPVNPPTASVIVVV